MITHVACYAGFPVAVSADLFEAASHHGLVSSSFLTPFLSMMGLTSGRSDQFWRSLPLARSLRPARS